MNEYARARRVFAITQAILADDAALGRLHPLERLMVHDLQDQRQRRRCAGCVRLVERLYRKAFARDYPEDEHHDDDAEDDG